MGVVVTSRTRTKAPEKRRDELMVAAQHLFLEQGVGATTIEQIALGAEVAKGTFYLYFSSKEDVLAALRDRFAQELLLGIKAAVADKAAEDWMGKLAAWAEAGVAGYVASSALHDMLFYAARPATSEGLVDNILIDDLVELLAGGVAAEAWYVEDARFVAVFLFNGLHGVVDGVKVGELGRMVQGIFLRAVGL